MAEALLAAALGAYGGAAVTYGGQARHPGTWGRTAIWAVRLGWVVHTALLFTQAIRSRGFAWSSWAGSLDLFVWLVVGAYLIWGCRAHFRVLGAAVMPLAATLLAVAAIGGAAAAGAEAHYSAVFLALHVGLVLAAFAGFTLAAALSAIYLWQEQRLKRREARILRLRVPSLVTLDALAARTVAVALPALTLGILAGLARLQTAGGGLDALMAVTIAAWLVYAALLLLRYEAGWRWRGRRAAYLVLAGFALVLAARLGVPLSHFAS